MARSRAPASPLREREVGYGADMRGPLVSEPGTGPVHLNAPTPLFKILSGFKSTQNGLAMKMTISSKTHKEKHQTRTKKYDARMNGALYRRSPNDIALQCISADQGRELLAGIHEGDCVHNSSPRTLASKAFNRSTSTCRASTRPRSPGPLWSGGSTFWVLSPGPRGASATSTSPSTNSPRGGCQNPLHARRVYRCSCRCRAEPRLRPPKAAVGATVYFQGRPRPLLVVRAGRTSTGVFPMSSKTRAKEFGKPLKPSGRGALSTGVSYTVLSISYLEKGFVRASIPSTRLKIAGRSNDILIPLDVLVGFWAPQNPKVSNSGACWFRWGLPHLLREGGGGAGGQRLLGEGGERVQHAHWRSVLIIGVFSPARSIGLPLGMEWTHFVSSGGGGIPRSSKTRSLTITSSRLSKWYNRPRASGKSAGPPPSKIATTLLSSSVGRSWDHSLSSSSSARYTVLVNPPTSTRGNSPTRVLRFTAARTW
ncbi:hypothetical protein ZWY2020_028520, partial [Hordeum vulgare]